MPTAKTTPRHEIRIFGFEGCGYFTAALSHLQVHSQRNPNTNVTIITTCVPRQQWQQVIAKHATQKGLDHTTSPLIFCNAAYIGGHDALVKELKKKTPFAQAQAKPKAAQTKSK